MLHTHIHTHTHTHTGKLLDAPCVAEVKRQLDLGVPHLGPYSVVDVSPEYCRYV